MTALEVLDAGEPTLGDLAATAQHEHAAAQDAALEAVQHAILAGEALLIARQRCERGGWLKWFAANVDMPYGTASTYMRVARFKELVRIEGVTTIAHAKKLLIGMPEANPSGESRLGPEIEASVRQLSDDGMSQRAIAGVLGVSKATVERTLDPRRRERATAKERRRNERKRVERERERELAVRRAARKAAKPLADAYAAAERMQDLLGQAHAQATDAEAIRALSLAGEHYRRMRDQIVRALGVAR